MGDRFMSAQGQTYIAQHGCIGEVGADTQDTFYKEGSVEHALFRALDIVRGATPGGAGGGGEEGGEGEGGEKKGKVVRESYCELGRAPRFSRASRCDKGAKKSAP
jgi:hypothetical protein